VVTDVGGHDVADIGEYCRRVEDHLTRVNGGHLVRIVGPGFELVRGWAEAGVPLSVVYRGIENKAERHEGGASKRPLRIEFCAGDVRALFERWRRAVGLSGVSLALDGPEHTDDVADEGSGEAPDKPKRPSIGRHIDRAIDRLSRAMARADCPAGLREACEPILTALAELRASSVRVRGEARDIVVTRLAALDRELAAAAHAHGPHAWLDGLRAEAAAELAPFRGRLDDQSWTRSMEATIDRLLRDRFGLPFLDL
jgi:hypothetical protein